MIFDLDPMPSLTDAEKLDPAIVASNLNELIYRYNLLLSELRKWDGHTNN